MIINVKIEIPKNSMYKYEKKKDTNTLVLDRVLNQPVPYNYGFVPDTMAGDGDPLDVFVVSTERIEPLSEVKAKILFAIKGKDNGKQDDKLVCILDGERIVDPYAKEHIVRYLSTYKKDYVIESVVSYEEAVEIFKL